MLERGEVVLLSQRVSILLQVFEAEDVIDEDRFAVKDILMLRFQVTVGRLLGDGAGGAYERQELHVEDEVVGIGADSVGISLFVFPAGDESCPGGSGDTEAEVALDF